MKSTTVPERLFFHRHPYPIFIPPACQRLIIGTLPPPRFTLRTLRVRDVDFCYGSCDGMLWPVLDILFDLRLRYDNSRTAVEQRLAFLQREKIGICDIVESCYRRRLDAADSTMEMLELRDIVGQLRLHPTIENLIFTGGSSKNGPEYLFRKQCRLHGIPLECTDSALPKKHRLVIDGRIVTTVSLTSPSNAANRAIGATARYKKRRRENPGYTTLDYRVEQYRAVFGSSFSDRLAKASRI